MEIVDLEPSFNQESMDLRFTKDLGNWCFFNEAPSYKPK